MKCYQITGEDLVVFKNAVDVKQIVKGTKNAVWNFLLQCIQDIENLASLKIEVWNSFELLNLWDSNPVSDLLDT